MVMDTNFLVEQDLTDLLQINRERVKEYNTGAYRCENLQLKMLLNRELDNSRDLIFGLKQLLVKRFDIPSDSETRGHLFKLWSDFKPLIALSDPTSQLHSFQKSDLLTLQCYHLVIARPYMDVVAKHLLKFQYQNSLSLYNSLKLLREVYPNNPIITSVYSSRKSA